MRGHRLMVRQRHQAGDAVTAGDETWRKQLERLCALFPASEAITNDSDVRHVLDGLIV